MMSNYLSSGTKSKQNSEAKIDIGMARVVARNRGSFVDFFSSNDADLLPSVPSSPHGSISASVLAREDQLL
jgi:hypothetical protein